MYNWLSKHKRNHIFLLLCNGFLLRCCNVWEKSWKNTQDVSFYAFPMLWIKWQESIPRCLIVVTHPRPAPNQSLPNILNLGYWMSECMSYWWISGEESTYGDQMVINFICLFFWQLPIIGWDWAWHEKLCKLMRPEADNCLWRFHNSLCHAKAKFNNWFIIHSKYS